MVGCRSAICQPIDESGRNEGQPILAIDPFSAGLHQRVLISTDGVSTRAHVRDPKSPLRNIIVAVLDDSGKEPT